MPFGFTEGRASHSRLVMFFLWGALWSDPLSPPSSALSIADMGEDEDEFEEDEEPDPTVTVAGVSKKLGEVTDEDQGQMTNVEYQTYTSLMDRYS